MDLHPALSFCQIHDRFLFLDIVDDRYFGLGQNLAEAFASLLAGTATPTARNALMQQGLVVASDGKQIEPCSDIVPRQSLLDASLPSPPLSRLALLAWTFARTRALLARRGLASMAESLAATRQTVPPAADETELALSVTAYDRICLLGGVHDLCLPRSLALAMDLARRGYAAEVVLGVQLRPFSAHCWVEFDDRLINDRFDRVRLFTPIRRL